METQLRALREERNIRVDNMDDSSQTYGGVKDPYEEDTASQNLKVTPWVRMVVSGVELLRNPRLNKGTAFSNEERDHHHLRGLVPSAHMTEELQVERIMQIFRRCKDPMEKYVYMMGLQERNERLFYKVLVDHVTEVLPIVYTPTVGEACQKYGVVFRRPHGLYININDRGKIFDILQNWPETDVEVIVVTDGERILGLGDLGLQGMGIPVGKLSLYTALGGIRPSACLPIAIDVGTNNKELLKDSTYLGLPHLRVSGQDYYDLIDEFMTAVKQTYGEKVLIQFEDFANENAFFFLAKYSSTHLTFNDDIQGTAAVVLAGIHAALSITGANLADQKFLFNGAGEAGIGIAEMIAHQVSKQGNISLEDARKNIWMVDSKGLITKSRYDSLSLSKKIYAQEQQECRTLLEATKALRPSILVGTSGQKGTFTREVLEAVASFNRRPVIFALSNPTSKSECTAEEAYTHTEGRGIFASGSPFDPLEYNGEIFVPGQANNAYIFPGFGLGCVISGAIRIHDDMFLAASEALGKFVSERELDHGLVYPPFDKIRDVSAHIAAAVAEKAYELGLATRLPKPKDLAKYAYSRMYSPDYHSYR